MELQIENLHKQAVDAALANNWEIAVELNKKILSLDPEYLDAYLALGYAYLKQGIFKESKAYYQEALKIDPNNVIARNNIDKLAVLTKSGDQTSKDLPFDPNIFINLRGRTKVVSLLNVGKADILAALHIGEKVELRIKKRRIEVRNEQDEYVGALPDDISKRLMFFIEGMSVYSTFIKASTKNSVDVFIREEKKGRKVKNFISFPENIQDDLKLIIGRSQDDEELARDDGDEELDPSNPDELEPEEDETTPYDSLEEFDRNEKEEETFFSELHEDEDDDFDE